MFPDLKKFAFRGNRKNMQLTYIIFEKNQSNKLNYKAMAIRITCINKDNGYHENPNLAITHLGWVNEATGESGRNTRLEIYDWLKGGGEAYVKVGYGNKVVVITAETQNGTKYVKTQADSTEKNNLLSLQEC